MQSNLCIKCNENEPKWIYTCDYCNRGLCESCGQKIFNETNALIKLSSCEYCHHTFDTFCQQCKDHIYNIIEEETKRLAKGPEMKEIIVYSDDCNSNCDGFMCKHKRYERKLVTPYPSPYGENLTVESVCKRLYIDVCRCDTRCECYKNSIIKAHENQKIDFTVREVHIDGTQGICLDCLRSKFPNYGESYKFIIC